jgi:ferrochelatase
MKTYLLVNFGGPRNLEEIPSFLTSLLCDKDVVRTKFPQFFHNWFFGRIARKRALKVSRDYEEIGGKSPIFEDTEWIAEALSKKLGAPVLTFHRYLPATHAESLKKIESTAAEITVLPLFPQYCSATTGSIARFFERHVKKETADKLRWIKSYAAHPAYIGAFERRIADFLVQQKLSEEKTVLFFSAHGVPQSFIDQGDIYQAECQNSYREILKGFPNALGLLSYQSKFGKGEWLRPYTDEQCEKALEWNQGRNEIIFVPLSFTSDHIETLFEVEKLYLPVIKAKGLMAYRCPALNREPYWIDALVEIFSNSETYPNQRLIPTRNLGL